MDTPETLLIVAPEVNKQIKVRAKVASGCRFGESNITSACVFLSLHSAYALYVDFIDCKKTAPSFNLSSK